MVVLCPWLGNRPVVRENLSNQHYDVIYGPKEGRFHQDSPTGAPVLPFHVHRPAGSELNPFLVALSYLHKLQAYFARRKDSEPWDTSPHFALYNALHDLSTEIWTPLKCKPPPPAETVRAFDTEHRSKRVDANTIFTNLDPGEVGSASASNIGSSSGGGGQGQSKCMSHQQRTVSPILNLF